MKITRGRSWSPAIVLALAALMYAQPASAQQGLLTSYRALRYHRGGVVGQEIWGTPAVERA